MPIIDGESIEHLVSTNLQKIGFTSEETEKITPKLAKYYYFLKDQELSKDIEEKWFNYDQRVDQMLSFDEEAEIRRLSNFKDSLTETQVNVLHAYETGRSFSIRTHLYEYKEGSKGLIARIPELLARNPKKIAKNFATLGAYLYGNILNGDGRRENFRDDLDKLFMGRPELFLQSSSVSIGNIETVQKHFDAKEAVSSEEHEKWIDQKKDYRIHSFSKMYHFRKIALYENPKILLQDPEITINNIEEVSQKFRHVGLTDFGYFVATERLPELLTQTPEITISHINNVTRSLAIPDFSIEKHRNLQRQYIKMGVQNPELFLASSPLSQHFCQIYRSYERGDFTAATKTDEESIESVTNMLASNRRYFGKTINDLVLKQVLVTSGVVDKDLNTKKKFLYSSPAKIEKKCFSALGHPNALEPVPKIHTQKPEIEDLRKNYPASSFSSNNLLPSSKEPKNSSPHNQPTEKEKADNLLLRTLIRAGMIEGKLKE